jgi:hypothetical protein
MPVAAAAQRDLFSLGKEGKERCASWCMLCDHLWQGKHKSGGHMHPQIHEEKTTSTKHGKSEAAKGHAKRVSCACTGWQKSAARAPCNRKQKTENTSMLCTRPPLCLSLCFPQVAALTQSSKGTTRERKHNQRGPPEHCRAGLQPAH